MLSDFAQWFWEGIQETLSWIKDLAIWLIGKTIQLLVEGAIAAVNAIPIPDFFDEAQSAFGTIPEGVWWFASALEVGSGVLLILGAYLLRFILRRIPIFG